MIRDHLCNLYLLGLVAQLLSGSLPAQTLDLPPRPSNALSGSAFAARITALDLSEHFSFTVQTNAEFQKYSALGGRIQFILKENPEQKIFHTMQVERNGFIHSMVSGTPKEGRGYEYFGRRAYTAWIQPAVPATATNPNPASSNR